MEAQTAKVSLRTQRKTVIPSGVTRISRPPGAQWLEPEELGMVPVGLDMLDPAPF